MEGTGRPRGRSGLSSASRCLGYGLNVPVTRLGPGKPTRRLSVRLRAELQTKRWVVDQPAHGRRGRRRVIDRYENATSRPDDLWDATHLRRNDGSAGKGCFDEGVRQALGVREENRDVPRCPKVAHLLDGADKADAVE